MRFKIPANCLTACFALGLSMIGTFVIAADNAVIVTDQIVELRQAIGGSSSGDAAEFKEALQQVADAAVATDTSDEAKTCAKGCDLCSGDCAKCPVEGCASCAATNGDELPSCCSGKLPSRVSLNNNNEAQFQDKPYSTSGPNVYSNPYAQRQPAPNWASPSSSWGQQQYANDPSNQLPTQIHVNQTRPLYESAFSLEQIAHRLEMQNLPDEADTVRKAAIELRNSARNQSRKRTQ